MPITIHKTEQVFEKLHQYVLKDGLAVKRLTPSALNIYLDCRLKFYFKYIIGLHEIDKVQDTVDPAVFGNILHLIMENLFEDLISTRAEKGINKEDFEKLRNNVDKALHNAFSGYFSNGRDERYNFVGADIITSEIIEKYVNQILKFDEAYAPFQILGLEADEKEGYIYNLPVATSKGSFSIGLKGVIDRIDLKDGLVRVIDYKSGMDKKDVESIASLFESDNPKRNKAAFQTILYGLLFHAQHPNLPYDIMPGIFNIKAMFADNFDFRFTLKNEGQKGSEPINNVIPLLNDFIEGLRLLVAEIFDPDEPIDQTDDSVKCSYCPYAGICHR